MFRVKVCGMTRAQDVRWAAKCGADALGFQMSQGPRKITPALARKLVRLAPFPVLTVGVFVNEPLSRLKKIAKACGFQAVQLHGDEDGAYCEKVGLPVLKAVRMRSVKTLGGFGGFRVAALLLDRYNQHKRGGTGETFDWKWVRRAPSLRLPLVLAGGLNPDNVQQAIRAARPFGVDVASGVESRPGLKDPKKVKWFVTRAKAAFSRLARH